MRLINTTTLKLHEFYGTVPQYAILSHTWGDEEVTLEEFTRDPTGSSAGHKKIQAASRQARNDNLDFLWVDTCCIMKSSSAELSEAINSMFRWYQEAEVCYVYLVDFEIDYEREVGKFPFELESAISECRWFTRGWCLQELIVPRNVRFYDKEWTLVATKRGWEVELSHMTGIDAKVEDIAYCLLGIFNVNMPMLYGEGEKAFVRLQEEIIKRSNDLSIFGWSNPDAEDHSPTGSTYISLFADSPSSVHSFQ
ncbi:heterokaryon incompatibility protein-domain-containing protein [Immersiella caudata]|uniref:Heterokaryon incompatibility protein-domain-containing protein n=1 Tax=Immersiella caudata TaxID=314043 RepID=A0AA39WCX6_9PEZI|nr:heterokaryon incompatibility protein-domain-containing protein [Immersiella caudata]